MIQFEYTQVSNIASAMRGMRNPLNSWENGDTIVKNCCLCSVHPSLMECQNCCTSGVLIGAKDMELAQKLIKAGSSHRKFMRQIFVSVDITAPQYWWSEFDTYKVGTCANSCSKMHTLMDKPFEMSNFSTDGTGEMIDNIMASRVDSLNDLRDYYFLLKQTGGDKTELKQVWRTILQILPMSFNQKRTVTMTYENIFVIREQRAGHKLSEWQQFIDWTDTLPYLKEFTCE